MPNTNWLSPLITIIQENCHGDAELLIKELCRIGYDVQSRIVDNEIDFIRGLEINPDIIFTDCEFPAIDAPRVLQILQERGLQIPLIVIADPAKEDVIIECLRQGAADYLYKDHLARMGIAVERAIERKRLLEEYRSAHKQDEEQFARNRLLFEHGRDIILFVRLNDGQILDANLAAEQAYGYSRQELLTLNITDLRGQETLPLVGTQMRQASSSGSLFETIHRRKDGSTFPVEVSSLGTDIGGERANLNIIRDITERKQAEEEIRRLTHLYAVLSQVNQSIVRVKSHAELFAEICRAAVEFGGYPLVWIGAPDPQTHQVIPLAQAGQATAYLQEVTIFTDNRPEAYSPAGIAIRQGTSVIANALDTDPHTQPWRAAIRRYGFTAAAAFPLHCGETVCAVLTLYSNQPGFFNEAEVRLLEEVAGDISFALSRFAEEMRRQQAEEDLGKSEARYRALVELDPDTIFVQIDQRFAFINEAGLRLFGVDRPEQILGQNVVDYIHQDYRASVAERIRRLNEDGLPVPPLEEAFLRADGTAVMVEVEAVPIEYGGKQGALVLARDITERVRAEQQLRESEERYRALVELSPESIGILCDGQITYINPAGLALFGAATPDQLVGRPFSDLIPLEDLNFIADILVHTLEGGEIPSIEQTILRVDGRPVPVEVRGTAFAQQGQPVVLIMVRDITARKQAEQEIERRLTEMDVLHRAALAGTEASSLDRLIEQVTTILEEGLYPTDFGIAFLDEQRGMLAYHPSARTLKGIKSTPIPIGAGISGSVAKTGIPRRVADVRLDPDYIEADPAIRSQLCVPLAIGGRVIGVINVESMQLNAFSWADEQFLVALAGELGMAIEKIRLLEAERNRRRELEILADVSLAAREVESRGEILAAVLDRVVSLLEAQAAAIAMRDAQTGELVFELARGAWEPVTGLHMQPGAGIGDRVIANQTPYLSEDIRNDPRLYRPDLFGAVQCLLCVPFINVGNAVGLLYIGRDEPIQQVDIHLTLAVTDISASAIHRAQLLEETRRQVQRLTALRAIDQAILSNLDLQMTIDVFLEQVTSLLGVDAAALLLYQPHLQMLEIAAGRGLRPSFLQGDMRLPMGETHSGRAALERKLGYIPDLSKVKDELTANLERCEERFTSYIALPLVAKDEIKGVLELFHRTRLDPDADWMEFLQSLGNQAAIAIDNAQLFSRQRQANLSLQIAYDDTIEGWSRALDLRDKETEGHSRRVTEFTLILASQMGIPYNELPHIRRGAQLHDIGKMGIPDSILLKPGPLTPEEWVLMRKHPEFARNLLLPITYLRPAIDIPYSHHEKWDGTGYPLGLRGEQIPLAARIFAVVDVWDAITNDRPYRPAWNREQALQYIQEQAGKHFDPQVVKALLAVVGKS